MCQVKLHNVSDEFGVCIILGLCCFSLAIFTSLVVELKGEACGMKRGGSKIPVLLYVADTSLFGKDVVL